MSDATTLVSIDKYMHNVARSHICVTAVWRTRDKPHYYVVMAGTAAAGNAMSSIDALAAAMKLKIRVVHSTHQPAANSYPVQVYPHA